MRNPAVGMLQMRNSMSGGPQRVRSSSIGGGEAARVAAMHAAITQGMTPKQAYNSISKAFPAVAIMSTPVVHGTSTGSMQ